MSLSPTCGVVDVAMILDKRKGCLMTEPLDLDADQALCDAANRGQPWARSEVLDRLPRYIAALKAARERLADAADMMSYLVDFGEPPGKGRYRDQWLRALSRARAFIKEYGRGP